MLNLMNQWKDGFNSLRKDEEGADIVQTILITVLFVIVVIVVGGIIYNAVRGQADRVGNCLQSADPTSANKDCGK